MSHNYSDEEIARLRRYQDCGARVLGLVKKQELTSLEELRSQLASLAAEDSLRYEEPLYKSHQYLQALITSLLNGPHLRVTADRRLELGEPLRKRRFRAPRAKARPLLTAPRGRLSSLAERREARAA